jgi:glutathione synthase/RimK-type ligase-like ATP-grasp enzyme
MTSFIDNLPHISLFNESKKINYPLINLNEEKDEQIQIVILTSSTNRKDESMDKAPTVQKTEDLCKKKGIKCYTVYADTATVEKTDKGKIYIKNFNEKGLEINKDNTVIIVRRGVLMHRYSLNLLSRLERMRFFTLNQRSSIEICDDKYLTTLKLVDAGLPIPKTVIIPNEETIDQSLEKIGNKFPVVIKTLTGTKGIGVFIVNDYESLKPILQTI